MTHSLLIQVLIAILVRSFLSFMLIFGSKGTINWLEGWLLFVCTAGLSAMSQIVLVFKKTFLAAERLCPGAGQSRSDRLLCIILNIAFNVWLIVLGIKFGETDNWALPNLLVVPGLILLLMAQGLLFYALMSNDFSSSVVRAQHDFGQFTVEKGPYRFVRHPMYAANIMLLIGGSWLTGSLAGCMMGVAIAALFVIRLILEERMLLSTFPCYAGYCARVKNRLIPLLW